MTTNINTAFILAVALSSVVFGVIIGMWYVIQRLTKTAIVDAAKARMVRDILWPNGVKGFWSFDTLDEIARVIEAPDSLLKGKK